MSRVESTRADMVPTIIISERQSRVRDIRVGNTKYNLIKEKNKIEIEIETKYTDQKDPVLNLFF